MRIITILLLLVFLLLRGKIQTFDQHMNMLLTEVEDVTEEKPKNLDKIILRGDNILIVSIPEE